MARRHSNDLGARLPGPRPDSKTFEQSAQARLVGMISVRELLRLARDGCGIRGIEEADPEPPGEISEEAVCLLERALIAPVPAHSLPHDRMIWRQVRHDPQPAAPHVYPQELEPSGAPGVPSEVGKPTGRR